MINKERKKWRLNRDIKMEERGWEGYFRELLGRIETKVIWREREKRRKGMEGEMERREIDRVVRGLKDRKAIEAEYRTRYENMEGKRSGNGCGEYAIRYGEGSDGRNNGGRGWWYLL